MKETHTSTDPLSEIHTAIYAEIYTGIHDEIQTEN